ncbi:MAG TPA: autotransporter outer membrane beta-barrel domain-containing protein [Steroidobacteraceae bacterium]|nr:autotransporter outer membrane beta-barrel domain-containing protein [Steroidobacteraceae bacterium]
MTTAQTRPRLSSAAVIPGRAHARARRAFKFSWVLASSGLCTPALADLTALQFSNPIEQAAALANQATYDQLTGGEVPLCDAELSGPAGGCTGAVFEMFSNVRELVETANELTNSGSTRYSLRLDQENLGFALRWTAAEEMAAQGSSATQFTNSQLNSLASRISALRVSALGRTARNDDLPGSLWALGGGAGADDSIAKRWGGFLNGAFGYGRKDDTTDPFNTTGSSGAEDAFDFDGSEITLGADYRLSESTVLGTLLGFSQRRVDFDSAVSIVDGTIDTDGSSLMFFAMWENDRFYVSGSLGGQWLEYDFRRRITYPSLNPLVAPVDVTTTSSTDSNTLMGTLSGGANFNVGGFAFAPYAKAEYQKVSVDEFAERGGSGFEFGYGEQDIKSFQLAAGATVQYVFTPRFGVIVPYARAEIRKEFENDPRNISATYASMPTSNVTTAQDFNLATDEHDDQFFVVAGGFSVVLKGGLQGFLQYQQVLDLDTFSDRVIAGGIRLEF